MLGPSGCGKSSLVKAGLIPALRAAGSGADRCGWSTCVPGPTARRAGRPADSARTPSPTAQPARPARSDDRSLAWPVAAGGRRPRRTSRLGRRPARGAVHLVRDGSAKQLHRQPRRRRRRPGRAGAAWCHGAGRLLRKCAAFAELAQLMAAHQHLVTPLSEDGWRAAVEEPAWRSGRAAAGTGRDDPGPTPRPPGELPMLQAALVAVWQRRRGNVLTLDGYVAAGAVAGAVARQADTGLRGSSGPEQQAWPGRSSSGWSSSVTGRRTPDARPRKTSCLAGPAARPPASCSASSRRGSSPPRGMRRGRPSASLHEALITGWPRLRAWLDEGREHCGSASGLTRSRRGVARPGSGREPALPRRAAPGRRVS